jgi:hypothetical protein
MLERSRSCDDRLSSHSARNETRLAVVGANPRLGTSQRLPQVTFKRPRAGSCAMSCHVGQNTQREFHNSSHQPAIYSSIQTSTVITLERTGESKQPVRSSCVQPSTLLGGVWSLSSIHLQTCDHSGVRKASRPSALMSMCKCFSTEDIVMYCKGTWSKSQL